MNDLRVYVSSFSTVFQSYQDDGWVIMKGCEKCDPFTSEQILPQAGLEPLTTRSAGLLGVDSFL